MNLLIWTKDQKILKTPFFSKVKNMSMAVSSSFDAVPNLSGIKLLLCLGQDGKTLLETLKIVPKTTIYSNRKKLFFIGECAVLLSYSPSIKEVDYSKYVDLLTDINLAVRYCTTGKLEPTLGDYTYVEDLSQTLIAIKSTYEQTKKPIEVALDLETVGLDPYADGVFIVTLQVSYKEGHSHVIHFPSKVKSQEWFNTYHSQVIELLTSPYVSLRGANLKYDLHWLSIHVNGIECTNFKFDTTLVGSLLDENRSNGLDIHAKIYSELGGYSDKFDKEVDKSRMDLVDKNKLLDYAGGDTDACLRVSKQQKKELLSDPKLTSFYVNILHPAARAFEKVEQGGVCIDREAYKEIESDLRYELIDLIGKAKKILGGRLIVKHKDEARVGGLNLTKASLLKDFMFSKKGLDLEPKMWTGKTQEPSTAMDHLLMFAEVPEAREFVGLLKDYASANTTLNTYVTGFLKHVRRDGRYHPSYWFFAGNKGEGEGGTNTGRLSCKDPAFQCMVGETLVLTDYGYIPLSDLVKGYELGTEYKVLTHTGKWKKVIGVFRNGVHPVFSVSSERGIVRSTGNHPYLTNRGWVLTEDLLPKDTIYAIKRNWSPTSHTGLHQPHLLQLGSNEKQVYESNQQRLEELRWQGGKTMSEVVGFQELLGGHGGKASEDLYSILDRAKGREWGLHEGKLHLGDKYDSAIKQAEYQKYNVQWNNQDGSTLGEGLRYFTREAPLPSKYWNTNEASLDEREIADFEVFETTPITGVMFDGFEETFDITVEGSHSFIAEGVIVHNTIPKHTKWAKKLRKCFIAPPGMLVLENDYSQGELRVIACVANETTMLETYKQGLDLHVVTSGNFSNKSYDAMMKLKKEDKGSFDALRQLGKAGNFGLIYGISLGGFLVYAKESYGVSLSEREGGEFIDKFFATYPELKTYHRNYKSTAHKHGFVRSPLGRIRHLPLISSFDRKIASQSERQSINSPIQSTLSDMLIWSIALASERGWNKESPSFGAIHDACYTYIPEDNFEMYAERTKDLMENLPFERVGWNPQLKFPVDGKVGRSMGELTEITKL